MKTANLVAEIATVPLRRRIVSEERLHGLRELAGELVDVGLLPVCRHA